MALEATQDEIEHAARAACSIFIFLGQELPGVNPRPTDEARG